jgi:hypothetical protein
MDNMYSAEIYRQVGVKFRSIRLSARTDGSLRMDAQEMGEFVEKTWVIPTTSSGSAFLQRPFRSSCSLYSAEKYSGRSGAVDKFREFRKKEGVEFEWNSWYSLLGLSRL